MNKNKENKSNAKLFAIVTAMLMLFGGLTFLIPADESDATDGVFEALSPGSWTWDETTGLGPFNSFYAAFDINNGNAFVSVLNPNDLSKKIDGTTLGSGYNIMWVIPTIYWAVDASGNLTLSNDSSKGVAYAHTIDGHTYNYIAIGVYEATSDDNSNPTKLTSETGKMPLVSKTRAQFRTLADAYTMDTTTLGADAHSMLWNFYQWELYKYCSLAVMENFNSQNTVGNGHAFGSTYAFQTGSTNTMGPYAGNNGLITDNTTGTSYGSDSVKLFIENAWAGVNEFVDGAVFVGNTGVYIDTTSVPTDSTTAGTYVTWNALTMPTSNGFPTNISTTAATWGWGTGSSYSGTATTGLCDKTYPASSSTGNKVLAVGGSSVTAASVSVNYGLSYADAYYDASDSAPYIGSRLALVFDAGPAAMGGSSYSYGLVYDPTAMATTSAALSVAGMNPITHDAPQAYTATIESNNTDYGTVSTASITDIEPGTAITISQDGLTLTIGEFGSSVARPTSASQQYTYVFDGWYIGSTPIESGVTTVNDDITITAKFSQTLTKYTVTIQSNDPDYGDVDVGTVNNTPYGSVMNLTGEDDNILTISDPTTSLALAVITATANDPDAYYTYGFDGYETDGQRIQDGDTITGARTIIAHFSATNIYTVLITPSPEGYGYVTVGQVTGVPSGNVININGNVLSVNNIDSTARPAEDTVQYDYSFSGWSVADNTPVNDNMTVYANFTRTLQTYTITWSINGVTETETYEYGTTPTHTDPTVTGYTFGGWNPTIASVTGDQTYTAILTPIQYTVTWNANGGTVDVATSTGSIEQSITAPIPTKKWYVFDGWFTAAEGGTQIESTFYPTENATYYAHWSELSYTVTLDGNGGTPGSETVTGSPISSATLPTATNADKHLIGWFTETTEGTLVGIPGTIVYPSADVTYHAVWSDDVVYTYNVNFNLNGGYDGPSALVTTSTTEGTQTLTIPDTIPKTDNTSKKYFAGWSKSSTATTSTYKAGDEITVNANESITLYAVFTQSAPIDYGWMKVIPILVGVGLLVGVVSMFITNRMSAADLAKAIATIAVGVILLVFVLIPISGGF